MSGEVVSIEVRLPPLPCDGIFKCKGMMSGKDLLTIHSCINMMESIYNVYSQYTDKNGRIQFNNPKLIKEINYIKKNKTKYCPYVSEKALANCISLAELVLTKYNIRVSMGEGGEFPTVCNQKFQAFKEDDGTLRIRFSSKYYSGTVSLFD